MSVGIFGNKKLSDSDIESIDVLYAFSPNRETLGDQNMVPMFNTITNNDVKKMLGADGMYKLRLPATIFKDLGFYTVLIKPKTIQVQILDCSYIVTSDNTQTPISKKGIVIPSALFQKSGSLVGYQIEYFDKNNQKVKNLSRIVTSSDLVSMAPNNNTVNQSSTSYVLDPNGNNIFLTLTPDETNLISNAGIVDIGQKGQNILISNTFFDPVMLEIEMVDMTIQTLGIALYGNSTRDLGNGILSYYDTTGNIYRQYNLYTRKATNSSSAIDFREERGIVNLNQNFADVKQGLTT